MAQTRTVARNTFEGGLVMDFSPSSTPANVLTNALNATFLTFNGNLGPLLNDMGNGRVETAFLPEGYIPMGVCEFGGIIYIVSYNPQDDLCQIGSFPSPERNITKEDRLSTDLMPAPLSNEYFLELSGGVPTGKLKSLVSKVVIRLDALNPGDKYIIESNREEYSSDDIASFSGLKDDTAKKIKLSIVSIEDSGKVTKLNTTNYEVNTEEGKAAFNILNASTIGPEIDTDIDAYRKNLAQNYNVFSSKIPGKLAILAELEVISEFSCGHRIVTRSLNINGQEYTTHDIYLDYKWSSNNANINPAYITLTDFKWESLLGDKTSFKYDINNKEVELFMSVNYNLEQNSAISTVNNKVLNINLPQLIDGNVSNFYHTVNSVQKVDPKEYLGCSYMRSIYDNTTHLRKIIFNDNKALKILTDELGDIEINNILELSNSIYMFSVSVPSNFGGAPFKLPFKLRYSITPAMSFGLLDHLAVTNEIDFSKIGTKLIRPNRLKYFALSDLLTLNLGTEIYEEENHKVTNMILEFYDLNGFCGSYFLEDRESYQGNITLNIPLNALFLKKYKYSDANTAPWYHNISAAVSTKASTNVKLSSYTADSGDCGMLYSNVLYGVKLIYIYSALNPITLEISEGEEEKIEKGFWLYTTGQFNELYYSVEDFSTLNCTFPLIYSYKLQDKTVKNTPVLTENTLTILEKMLNADNAELQKLNTGKESLVSTIDYSGNMDLNILLGFPANTDQSNGPINPYYGLLKCVDKELLPNIDLFLISPEYAGKEFVEKTFTVIEAPELTENSEEVSTKEYTKYDPSSYLRLKDSNLSINEQYEANTSLQLNLKKLEFGVVPTEYKKILVNSQILTPVLYKDQSGIYNYKDVGGEEMFEKALCYAGSDDSESKDRTQKSDDAWYNTNIASDFSTYDSILHEYDPGVVHTNILDGHEALSSYYKSLGNRQPFTLFTILKLLEDSSSKATLGYSTKWTSNVFGPGNIHVKGDKLYDFSDTFGKNKTKDYIVELHKNHSSEFTPDPEDRSYLPAFISNRIALGGHDVMMSSTGGVVSTEKIEGTNRYILPYSAYTGFRLKRDFYSKYLQTMKEILTVNPDRRSCEVGTFTYNEDNCKDLQLISLIYAKIHISDEFKKAAPNLICLHEIKFSDYIDNLLGAMDPLRKILREDDRNVALEFDTSILGDGELVPVTYINYNVPHNRELLDEYINYENSYLVQYLNGYYNKNLSSYIPQWSENIHKVDIPISENRFYMAYSENGQIKFQQITTNLNRTDKDGHIITGYFSNMVKTKSNLQYSNPNSPIFYNTNMTIDDFTWDPENKYHHFYYIGDSNLTIVDPKYSYLLDDDNGYGTEKLTVRSYYIGPSFTL